MRNLKKILALVLALMMVMSMMVTASAASFEDAESINYAEAVSVMADIGVLKGYEAEDGTFTFKPEGTLTRAEAAKIITYVLTGGDLDAAKDADEHPFTDVPNWASSFVGYCYNEGIVNGRSATTFDAKGTITGYEFAKMLLIAVGVEGTFTGSSWKLNVATAAYENNQLTAGLANGYSLKNDITREEAAQMTLNAMKIGTTTVLVPAHYTVAGSTAKFTSASEAYFYAMANAVGGVAPAVTFVPAETETDALLTAAFGVEWTTPADGTVDEFGRPATNYFVSGTTYSVYFPVEADLTYTTATTEGKIWSALGYASAAQTITLNYFVNGNTLTSTSTNVTKGDTTDVGAQGTLVEVYQTGSRTYSVVVIETEAIKLDTPNLIAAVPATSSTDAVPALLWIDLNDDGNYDEGDDDEGELVVNPGFVKNQVVLYTVANGELASVEAAEYVTGAITATASTYLRVGADQKYLAAKCDGSIGSGAYALGTTGYTYYVDTYGNLIMAVVGVPATVAPNYVYVIATKSVAKDSGTGENLFDITETSAAAAQAKIIDLATGEIKIVNVATTLYNGNYYYVNADGTRSATVVGSNNVPNGSAGLRAYTELADGSIVIGSAAVETAVTVEKGVAAVASGKYANSSTVLTVVEYTTNAAGAITGATVTTTTGIANFPVIAKNYNAVVSANATTGVVANMLVVKAVDAPQSAVDYAVYAGRGETFMSNNVSITELFYYVGGEKVCYYAATASIGSTVTASAGVYDITLTNGVLTGTTPVSADNSNAMTVVTVDDTYMVVKSAANVLYTIYFAETGYECYNADAYYTADTIAAGDLVFVYGADKSASPVWTGINLVVINN